MGTDPLGLAGSQFTLNYLWDASTLVPVFDQTFGVAGRLTVWPNTNTTASVTIAGSTSADGTFSATPSGGAHFQLIDNDVIGDAVGFMPLDFIVGAETITVAGLLAGFPSAFNTPPAPGTVIPYSFQNSDVISWQTPSIHSLGPLLCRRRTVPTLPGVPASPRACSVRRYREPSSVALLALGFGYVLLRRR